MKIIEASAGLLTNFEVLDFLRNKGKSSIKDEKNSEIRNSDTEVGQDNESDIIKLRLTPSEMKVYDYLINTAARDQTRDCVSEFLRKCKKYELAQADILPILNLRPSEPTAAVELFSMVELFYKRYENEESELIQIIDETIYSPSPISSSTSAKTRHFSLFSKTSIKNPQNLLNSRNRTDEAFRRKSNQQNMECVFGIVGDGFVLLAADSSAVHSILVHKSDEDKIMVLDSHKLVAASGEPGDRVQFTEYIQKNVALYQFKNGIPLTTSAAANFTRGELATALRKNPYTVNILMAGFDKDVGASMYYIDYLATMHKVEKGAFGYGSYFSLAMMDRHFKSNMTVEEAVDLADKCIAEIRSRLVVSPPNFVIKIVDKDGARVYAWRKTVDDPPTVAVQAEAVQA